MARPARLDAAVSLLMAAVIASACSLTSLEGLSGGDETGAGVPDSSSSDAATGDAVALGDGAPLPFCATADPTDLALCADFDDARDLPAPFSETIAVGGGAVALDANDFRSSPRSVLFTVGRPGGDSAAGLAFRMTSIATQVSFDMDVRVDALGNGGFDVLTVLRANVQIGLQINQDGDLEIDREVPDGDGGRVETAIPLASTMGSAWRHIRFEASPDNGSPSTWNVRVLVDGAMAGGTTVPSAGFVGQPEVVVGDDIVFPTDKPWRIRVDNVLARAR